MGKNSKSKSKSKTKSTKTIEEDTLVEDVHVQDIQEDLQEEEDDLQEEQIQDDDMIENSTGNQDSSKKVKKQFVFQDEFTNLEKLREAETKLREEKDLLHKNYELKLKEINSLMKKNRKDQNLIFSKLSSLHNSEVKSASKEKRKRTGVNTGGFNKLTKVPSVLADYLDLDKDTPLARHTVFHLLNEKFKSEGLKNGQETVLDKKNAKALGKQNGFKITFKEGQTFLASFYNQSEVNV